MSVPGSARGPMLRRYGLPGQGRPAPAADDPELDAVVRLAQAVTGLRAATVNIVDETLVHHVATVGCPVGASPRSASMCATHFEGGRTVAVADAREDPRFAASPWVTGKLGAVRAYATAPLVTDDGLALGTLCVFDERRVALDAERLHRLEDCARVLVGLLEGRRRARVQEHLALVTEEQRLLLELTLEESAARQELTDAILDTIDVAVVASDPAGHVTLFNRTASDWHGTGPDPHIGPEQHAQRYRLAHVETRAPLAPHELPLQRALADGSVQEVEMLVQSPDRPARHVSVSGRSLLRGDGTVLGAVVAMADVTTDRAQQAALQRAHAELLEREQELVALVDELERSNTDLEHFAAVASHDLASPLAVVAGYVELIGDVHGDALGEQGRAWVGTALRAAGRMQQLITSLLSYAQAGSAACRPEPTDLRDVAEQAVLDLRTGIVEAGAEVVLGPLPTADADPTLLRQLLQNLVGNAVRYRRTDRPCVVRITAEAAGTAEGGWEVAVADNGTGIPAEHRTRVFEVFAQVDATARTGHGLGLATCQRIVERHGGRIWAEETPGGGATVRFTLPGPAHPGPAPVPLPVSGRSRSEAAAR